MKNKAKVTLLAVMFVAIIITGGVFAYSLNKTLGYKGIYGGVYVDNYSLEGMTLDEAKKFLNDNYQKRADEIKVKARYEGNTWVFNYKDTKISFNCGEIAKKAFELGRGGNIIDRITKISSLKQNPITLSLTSTKSYKAVEGFVNKISNELYKGVKEPSLKKDGADFIITPGKNGLEVNINELKKLVVNAINEQMNKKSSEDIEAPAINVPVKILKPTHDESKLSKVGDILGEFHTPMHGSDGRLFNLSLSAKKINGKVLFPGDIISLNKTLGPRIASNGFKTAPIIVDNKVTQGDGGGVCQVATTLYGAVIRSVLAVEERAHHTIPSSYCPLGQDATIAGDYLDFKFRNSLNYPIYISSWADKWDLHVRIYGYNEHPDQTVSIESNLLKTIPVPPVIFENDNTLPKGQMQQDRSGYPGYVVNVYRIIKENGVEKSRQLLSKNKYDAIAPIIKIGTK